MNIQDVISNLVLTTKDSILNIKGSDMPIKPMITQEESQVSVELCTGFPCNILQEQFVPELLTQLKQALPQLHINLSLSSFIKAHQTQLIGKGLRHVKNTIAIASGKGGVGKSTVAVNMATALAREGAQVGLLDADIYGPSIPLMLGVNTPVELDNEHYRPMLAHGVQTMSMGYLSQADQALIWRGPMLAKALLHMLDNTQWDDLDYLFIDLPPGTGDIPLSLVQKIPLSGAVIVTTPQTVATLDAQKALQMFSHTGIHILGIIENMSLHTCSQCGHEEALFGQHGAQQLCQTHQCELLGQLPLHPDIARHCDQGQPTAATQTDERSEAFRIAALRMTIALNHRPLNYANKFPPVVVE